MVAGAQWEAQREDCFMRTMMLIGFGLATCLPAMTFAASTAPVPGERALREECSAFSQAGMRDCLAKNAQDSQKALRNIEEEAVSALSRWDEESRYVSQAKAKLAASNREFSRYRDSQCEFSASLSGGGAGNAHEIRRLACVSEFNNRRAEQLRDAVSDLPRK
ncbi:lysozyme inhibitor LprI family protein [Cupriavidus basilensis]|nr:lysozyme inhibitor LprI family protein [Cupriavidus basilensis]